MQKKSETILAIGAHNDDHVIGAGGTLAKYALEGNRIRTVVFSYGSLSHPHFKPKLVLTQRKEEAKKADELLGGQGITYLGLEDFFEKELKDKKIKEKLLKIIKREKPAKIFTHSIYDAHPDHQSVAGLMKSLLKEIKCEVYTFDVWNVTRVGGRNAPKMIVDIGDTYHTKTRALKAHKSQIHLPGLLLLRLKMWITALIHGFNGHCRYAEVFYKISDRQ